MYAPSRHSQVGQVSNMPNQYRQQQYPNQPFVYQVHSNPQPGPPAPEYADDWMPRHQDTENMYSCNTKPHEDSVGLLHPPSYEHVASSTEVHVVPVEEEDSGPNASKFVAVVGTWMSVVMIAFTFILYGTVKGTWSDWVQASCLPDKCFCEAPRDGLLRQPANTWSNIAFTIVSAWNITRLKGPFTQSIYNQYTAAHVFAGIVIGAFSGWFHASLTLIGQWFDNMGMQCILLSAFVLQLHSLRLFGTSLYWPVYLGALVVLGYLEWTFVAVRRQMFGVVVAATLLLEVYRRKKGIITYSAYWLIASIVTLAVSFGIWQLDLHHIVCFPHSLLQGHALWHILDALAAGFMWKYFSQAGTIQCSPNRRHRHLGGWHGGNYTYEMGRVVTA